MAVLLRLIHTHPPVWLPIKPTYQGICVNSTNVLPGKYCMGKSPNIDSLMPQTRCRSKGTWHYWPIVVRPWWVTLHMRVLQMTDDDDRRQRLLLVWPTIPCVGGSVIKGHCVSRSNTVLTGVFHIRSVVFVCRINCVQSNEYRLSTRQATSLQSIFTNGSRSRCWRRRHGSESEPVSTVDSAWWTGSQLSPRLVRSCTSAVGRYAQVVTGRVRVQRTAERVRVYVGL